MADPTFLKEAFGLVALALTFIAFAPYIRAIRRRETRPHIFSWLIWGVGTVVVFLAQLSDGGGYGAWVIGVSGLITLLIAVLAWRTSADTRIVPTDWILLISALCAVLLWLATDSALSAVIILTAIDLFGFGPSARKAYRLPYEENATFFAIGALRNGFILLALQNYTWTTVLFPAAVGLACLGFVLFIVIRRRATGADRRKAQRSR